MAGAAEKRKDFVEAERRDASVALSLTFAALGSERDAPGRKVVASQNSIWLSELQA